MQATASSPHAWRLPALRASVEWACVIFSTRVEVTRRRANDVESFGGPLHAGGGLPHWNQGNSRRGVFSPRAWRFTGFRSTPIPFHRVLSTRVEVIRTRRCSATSRPSSLHAVEVYRREQPRSPPGPCSLHTRGGIPAVVVAGGGRKESSPRAWRYSPGWTVCYRDQEVLSTGVEVYRTAAVIRVACPPFSPRPWRLPDHRPAWRRY